MAEFPIVERNFKKEPKTWSWAWWAPSGIQDKEDLDELSDSHKHVGQCWTSKISIVNGKREASRLSQPGVRKLQGQSQARAEPGKGSKNCTVEGSAAPGAITVLIFQEQAHVQAALEWVAKPQHTT